jgi:dihydropteroate synthase
VLSIEHNPRVILAAESRPAGTPSLPGAARERAAGGSHAPDDYLSIALENVAAANAAILRERLAALAAAPTPTGTTPAETTAPLVLHGTARQFSDLAARLRPSPELAEIAQLIVRAIGDYGRRRWLLRARGREVELGPRPTVLGIINVTPDSFSEGGKLFDRARAIEHGLAIAAAGADVLDVGGESTRPGAPEVPAEEEMARVLPVIAGLRRQSNALISVDTRKASVARAALEAGADIINDVTALADPQMRTLAARSACPVILMHMQGTPATMQQNPQYDDVVADICRDLRRALARAAEAGVDIEQTIIDPGIGFGKTVEHNLTLLRRLGELRTLGRPILVGTSRKSFIGKILSADIDNRLIGSVATCVWARAQGAALLRVHDVAETVQALRITAAIMDS